MSRALRIMVEFWSSLSEVPGSESKGKEETTVKGTVANKKVAVEITLNNMPAVATCV